MLLSWVLKLQPVEPATAPSNLGRKAHAWFLERVAAVDAPLAAELHDGQGLRPFTVSNLWELGHGRAPEATLSPERSYTLRVTSLSPALSQAVKERVIPALPDQVTLGGVAWRVVASATDPSQHPWAAETPFEALVQQFTLAGEVPRSVGLRFASPTAFRETGKKRAVPLPLPQWVFGGLLDKWNAFSPIELHPDVRRYAEECLVVSSYRLQTRRVIFGEEGERGAYSGMVGHCRYTSENADRYWMGLIHLLAGFGLYAGVGLRTTMGLGQARALDSGADQRS